MTTPYAYVGLENVTSGELRRAWRAQTKIVTCTGKKRIDKHLVPDMVKVRRATGVTTVPVFVGTCGILYRCLGCKRLVCSCNGGTDDVRCDDCTVGSA